MRGRSGEGGGEESKTNNLHADKGFDDFLFRGRRGVPDDTSTVVSMTLANGFVIVRGRVVLHDVAHAEPPERGVQRLLVDLERLRGVLHGRGGL